MSFTSCRLRAAFGLVAVGLAAGSVAVTGASAQSKSIEVPGYRQLGAGEVMASPGQNGSDSSANAPSLAGLTLLATIPAPAAPRLGYFVQAQCTAGATVALDDTAGSLAPTLVVVQGASA